MNKISNYIKNKKRLQHKMKDKIPNNSVPTYQTNNLL